jgi:hypothetical protein
MTAAQIRGLKVNVLMIGRGPCVHLGSIALIATPNFNMFDFTWQSNMDCGATKIQCVSFPAGSTVMPFLIALG